VRDDVLYLLRLWRDGKDIGAWRASLEDLRSRETRRFDSLEALQRFLDERASHKSRSQDQGSGKEDA
jgi:hypothetical protein